MCHLSIFAADINFLSLLPICRRHKLSSNSKLCCTVLSNEEELPYVYINSKLQLLTSSLLIAFHLLHRTTAVVFDVRMRLPGEGRYGPPTEVG